VLTIGAGDWLEHPPSKIAKVKAARYKVFDFILGIRN
jgi:hypothetical protein